MRTKRQNYAETLYSLYETCHETYYEHCEDEENGWNHYDRRAQELIASMSWHRDWGCNDDAHLDWYYHMIHKAINYFDMTADWDQIFLISKALSADIAEYESRSL